MFMCAGYGDFALGAPTCAINIAAIQALYSLLIISQFGVLLMSLVFLHRTQKSRQFTRRTAGCALSILSSVCFIALGILRASNPTDSGIGYRPASTVLFCAGASLFWAYGLQFTGNLIVISLKQTKMQDENAQKRAISIIRRTQIALPYLLFIVVVICILPMFMLATSDPWVMYGLGAAHYEGLAFSAMFVGAILSPMILSPFLKDLSDAISRAKSMRMDTLQLETVSAKLYRIKIDLRNQGLFNLIFASPFGLFPFLQHLSSYWLPIAFICAAFVSSLAMWLELPVKRGPSSGFRGRSTQEKESSKSSTNKQASVMMNSVAVVSISENP